MYNNYIIKYAYIKNFSMYKKNRSSRYRRMHSKACHGRRSRVSFWNKAIFPSLGCISPEPSVDSLVSEVSVNPVGSPYRQIVRCLRLVIVKHYEFGSCRLVPEIMAILLLLLLVTVHSVSVTCTCKSRVSFYNVSFERPKFVVHCVWKGIKFRDVVVT